MNRKRALIFLVAGISGGTATLSYRIGLEFQKHEYDIYYMCTVINDKDNFSLFKESNIEIIHSNESDWFSKAYNICNRYQEVKLLTYNYRYMHIIHRIRKKFPMFDGFLYVVHTNALVGGHHTNNSLIRKMGKLVNLLNESNIEKMYQNKQILFMDQLTIAFTKKYTNLSFPDVEDRIFLLPYNVPKNVKLNIPKRNIIITMSRMEFPFKGYNIGLIDIFARIVNKYNAELWIIGDGDSMIELKKKIALQKPDVEKRIKLLYNVNYTKIGELLKQGKVFIGMGTSLLDAVSNGLPSIPVQSYTYQCLGKGFFGERPQMVGFEKDDTEVFDIGHLIEHVFSISDAEYRELWFKDYSALKNNYSIDNFYKRFSNLKNGNEEFTFSEMAGYAIGRYLMKVYLFLRKLRNKLL